MLFGSLWPLEAVIVKWGHKDGSWYSKIDILINRWDWDTSKREETIRADKGPTVRVTSEHGMDAKIETESSGSTNEGTVSFEGRIGRSFECNEDGNNSLYFY